MLNYTIDPAVLRKRVPFGTELDVFEGRTFVSIVGFQFLDARIRGIPIPFHRNFEEVNLRFYVRCRAGDQWRRGVVFVKEIVPRIAIAWTARVVYNENYVACPMSHTVNPPGNGAPGRVEYRWQYNSSPCSIGASIDRNPRAPEPGSEAEFITEHYWGYATQRHGSAIEYRVEHPQWSVWNTTDITFHCDVARVYGAEFVEALSANPASAFVAKGSEVLVRRGVRLTG